MINAIFLFEIHGVLDAVMIGVVAIIPKKKQRGFGLPKTLFLKTYSQLFGWMIDTQEKKLRLIWKHFNKPK